MMDEITSPDLEEEREQVKKSSQMTSEECIQEAIANLRRDREMAGIGYVNILMYAQKNKERFEKLGLTIAKFLEVLQRSNEQLVKIAALKSKKSALDEEISEEDKEGIFDDIQESVDEDDE